MSMWRWCNAVPHSYKKFVRVVNVKSLIRQSNGWRLKLVAVEKIFMIFNEHVAPAELVVHVTIDMSVNHVSLPL